MFDIVLVISGQTCTCHPNAVPKIVYDSSFRQPICRTANCSTDAPNCTRKSSPPIHCPLLQLRETISSLQPSKLIQVIENGSMTKTENISWTKCDRTAAACADPKNNERFGDYCIPQTLIKDYQSYRQYKAAAPTVIDIYADLEFRVFFCQTLRISIHYIRRINGDYDIERMNAFGERWQSGFFESKISSDEIFHSSSFCVPQRTNKISLVLLGHSLDLARMCS